MSRIQFSAFLLVVGAAVAQAPSGFAASLDGDQVVVPTGSQASAWAFVLLEGNGFVRVTVDVDGLATASVCELRHGSPGQTGATILALAGGPKTWTGTATLSSADAMAVENGATHVVVSSAAFPSGEIRGQVVARGAQRFTAELLKQNVVPPAAWNAQGTFRAHFYEPDNWLVVTFGGTSGIFSSHFELRMGAAGVNGPLLHTWYSQSSQGYTYGESRKLTDAEIQALRAGDLYIEAKGYPYPYTVLRSTARGQLRPVGDAWAGTLSGAAVVPPSGSQLESMAGCHGATLFDEWSFWTHRKPGENACHVRRGLPGTNGPVVFSLSSFGALGWRLTRTMSATELSWLENGELYFETETPGPTPHLRAQIIPDVAPAPSYGGGCVDSNGTLWHLGEIRGTPAVGAQWSMNHYILQMVGHGPRPVFGHGHLLVGFQRGAFGATPLPMRLDVYGGSPDCYLLTDITVVLPGGNGATQFIVEIPADQGLRGVHMYGQAVMFDPAAPGYFAVTNGLDLEIR